MYDKYVTLFSVPEVAQIFSVSPETVRMWTRKKKIISTTNPNNVRGVRHMFTQEEIARFGSMYDKYSKTNTGVSREHKRLTEPIPEPVKKFEPKDISELNYKAAITKLAELSDQLVETQATINALLKIISKEM